jgi:hypothetical protein
VVIRSIGRWEFDRLLPLHTLLETFIGKEVEWFRDDVRNIIGTVAGAKADRGWNYAIFKRDKTGKFRMCEMRRNLYNLHKATVDFLRAMAAAEKSGRRSFSEMNAT